MINRFEHFSASECDTLLQCLAVYMALPHWGMEPENLAHDELHGLFSECPAPALDINDLRGKIEHYVEGADAQAYAIKFHGLDITQWNVTGYTCTRLYGGPEEGGWYYDLYTRNYDSHVAVFDDEAAAHAYADFLNNGDGGICARVESGPTPPDRMPRDNPHYE